jgi:hypothetical protein
MTFVNLTPHTINLFAAKGDAAATMILASSGNVRVSARRIEKETEQGIPFFAVQFGSLEGMPNLSEIKGPTTFIVSAMAKEPLRQEIREWAREGDEEGEGFPFIQVCSPGELIRNEAGQPIGCHGLDF